MLCTTAARNSPTALRWERIRNEPSAPATDLRPIGNKAGGIPPGGMDYEEDSGNGSRSNNVLWLD